LVEQTYLLWEQKSRNVGTNIWLWEQTKWLWEQKNMGTKKIWEQKNYGCQNKIYDCGNKPMVVGTK
jgi:hypothetical protein